MTRKRLRDAYTEDELRSVYKAPHDHWRWDDHRLRVDVTTTLARWMAGDGIHSAADLSCGNGAILKAVPAQVKHFGDYAGNYPYQGPIEATISRLPNVDMFICSETLEHLDDPDLVLGQIRKQSRSLVLSTPIDAWDDGNPEHYWAWSREDVEQMLTAAGWRVEVFTAPDLRPMGFPYCFGIWGLR